jgi:Na+/H+-dicarboxylate symporter
MEALVATLMVIPSIPVAGMALILGLDRFKAQFMIGTLDVDL